MNVTVQIKNSANTGNTPSSLANGELAVNRADGRLFYKHANGTIVFFATGGGGSSNAFGVVNVTGQANVVATTNSDIFRMRSGTGIVITTDPANNLIDIAATGGSATDQFARDHSNGAFSHANGAYAQANIATTNADAAFARANAAYANANTAIYTAAQIRANLSNTAPINYDSTTGVISHADSGTVAGTYGNTTFVPTVTVDAKGHITAIVNTAIALPPSTDEFARAQANAAFNKANGSVQTGFVTVNVAGQTDVVADSNVDTLTLVAGSGVTITTDAPNDRITFSATGGGGGIDQYARNLANSGTSFIYANTNSTVNGVYTNWSTLYSAYTAAGSPVTTIHFYLNDQDANTVLEIPSGYYPFRLGTRFEGMVGQYVSGTALYFLDGARISGVGEFKNLSLQADSLQPIMYLSNYDDPITGKETGVDFVTLDGSGALSWNTAPFFFANTENCGLICLNNVQGGTGGAGYGLVNLKSNVLSFDIIVRSGDARFQDDSFASTNPLAKIRITRNAGTVYVTPTHTNYAGVIKFVDVDERIGVTPGRPVPAENGSSFYDTSLDSPIFHHGGIWTPLRDYFSNTTPILYDNLTGIYSLTTVPVALGGTGQTAITVNGSLLIGNTVSGGYDVNTLTQGTGIVITNAPGSITIAATGGSSVDQFARDTANGAYAHANGAFVKANAATPNTATANGQLMIGNTVSGGFDLNTLTQGTGISITNDKGSITIAATGGSALDQFARDTANGAYAHANGAFGHANGAFNKANAATPNTSTSNGQLMIGNTVSGGFDLNTLTAGYAIAVTNDKGSITVASTGDSYARPHANAAYAQANIATTNADAAFAKANAAYSNANTAIYTATQIRANISNTAPINYDPTTGVISHADSAVTATTYGNATFVSQLTVDTRGHVTSVSNVAIDQSLAQTARDHANGAFAKANIATTNADAAFTQANAAYANANTAIYTAAQIRANVSNIHPISYNQSTGQFGIVAANTNGSILISNTVSGGYDVSQITGGLGIIVSPSQGGIKLDTAVGKTYYMVLTQASDVATYNVALTSPSANTEVNTQAIFTGTAYSLTASFLTPNGEPGTTLLPSGTYGRHIHATTDGASNYAQLRIDLSKRMANGTEVLLRSGESPIFSSANAGVLLSWNVTDSSSYPLVVTDRLLWQMYVRRVSGGSGSVQVTVFYEGNTRASYLTSTILDGGADIFARIQANNAYAHANGAFAHANGAFSHANAAYNQANTATTNADAAFARANAAYANANTAIYTAAQIRANISATTPISYDSGTGIITHATSGVGATGYGDAASIPVFVVNATGHVTSVTNTAIAIAASQITSGILSVTRGGTGKDSTGLVNGALLIGNTVNTGFDLTTIAQTAPVIVTNGKGTVTLSHASSGVTATGYGTAAQVPALVVDQYGHVTSVTNTAIAITTAEVSEAAGGPFYHTAARVRGNVSATTPISYDSGTGVISHATSGVSATGYGDAASIPVFVVNATGHVTSVTNTAIAIAASQITSGTLTVARGGTGQTAIGLNGAVLISNTVSGGYDINRITAGTGIIVNNDKGSIEIVATGGSATDQFARDTANGAYAHANGAFNAANAANVFGATVLIGAANYINVGTVGPYEGGAVPQVNANVGNTLYRVTSASATYKVWANTTSGSIEHRADTQVLSVLNSSDSAGGVPRYFRLYSTGVGLDASIELGANSTLFWSNTAAGGAGRLFSLQALLSSVTTNGQLLIGNTVSGSFDVNTLTAGAGISITNNKGSITVSNPKPFMKSIIVMSPTISDNLAMFFTDTAITWTKVVSVVRGTTPNVVFNLTYANTRIDGTVGTDITGNITCANTTNGVFTTSFTNATVPANNYVVLQFSTVSGTVTQIEITMIS